MGTRSEQTITSLRGIYHSYFTDFGELTFGVHRSALKIVNSKINTLKGHRLTDWYNYSNIAFCPICEKILIYKCYSKFVRLSEKLHLTAALCNEI